jgi:hemoglobin
MSITIKPDPENRLRRTGRSNPAALDEAMIRDVVDQFYARARTDDLIGPVFTRAVPDDRWQAHLDTIADFWSSMLLGSGRYQGRPLSKHIALPELGDAHFQRWLALFRATAEKVCPPDIAAVFIDRSERVANSFRINIAMRRGESTIHMKPLEREDVA